METFLDGPFVVARSPNLLATPEKPANFSLIFVDGPDAKPTDSWLCAGVQYVEKGSFRHSYVNCVHQLSQSSKFVTDAEVVIGMVNGDFRQDTRCKISSGGQKLAKFVWRFENHQSDSEPALSLNDSLNSFTTMARLQPWVLIRHRYTTQILAKRLGSTLIAAGRESDAAALFSLFPVFLSLRTIDPILWEIMRTIADNTLWSDRRRLTAQMACLGLLSAPAKYLSMRLKLGRDSDWDEAMAGEFLALASDASIPVAMREFAAESQEIAQRLVSGRFQ